MVGEPVAGDSHAWVEWWDDGWHPFDLTSAVEPDDRYVVVATGRDYDDVKPLSGIYSGAATSGWTSTVEVTRWPERVRATSSRAASGSASDQPQLARTRIRGTTEHSHGRRLRSFLVVVGLVLAWRSPTRSAPWT